MTPADITAPNSKLNDTLNDGHTLQGMLQAQRLSANPRLYGNPTAGGWAEIPETSAQDNSDLPGWAIENWDGSSTIQSIFQGVGITDPNDSTTPIYLQVWVAEKQNFYDVAQVMAQVNKGVALADALF